MAFCYACGTALVEGAAFCSSCGKAAAPAATVGAAAAAPAAAAPAAAAPAHALEKKEEGFLREGEVVVTSDRFMVSNQTYAMSGVTSVSTWVKKPPRGFFIFLIIVGLLLSLALRPLELPPLGLLVLLLGIVLLLVMKNKYSVWLATASGGSSALISKDKEYIERVVKALNEAIVYRH
jgi:hypothetical protein